MYVIHMPGNNLLFRDHGLKTGSFDDLTGLIYLHFGIIRNLVPTVLGSIFYDLVKKVNVTRRRSSRSTIDAFRPESGRCGVALDLPTVPARLPTLPRMPELPMPTPIDCERTSFIRILSILLQLNAR